MREPLEGVLAANPRPFWSVALFGQMMRDLQQCGGRSDPIEQVGPPPPRTRVQKSTLHEM